MHWIKKYIIEQLLYKKYVRNRDLRPVRVESNLFQYHLNRLIAEGYVTKQGAGYTLDYKGLVWADHYSSALKSARPQPKIVTILGIQNDKGDYLLIARPRQPFIDCLHFPSGKIHQGESIADAADREALDKLSLQDLDLKRHGWAHITIKEEDEIVTEYFGFMFKTSVPKGFVLPPGAVWANNKSNTQNLMPGVENILEGLGSPPGEIESVINAGSGIKKIVNSVR